MTSRELLALLVVAVPGLVACVTAIAPRRHVQVVATIGALASSAAAAALSIVALWSPGSPLVERWVVVDAAAGLLVGVIGIVGLTAVLVSPAYLASSTTGLVRPERRPRTFYALVFCFWAILAAVPLVGNLGGAWLLLEATTAASALLVGFGGKPRALEAAWKYLILTSLGLGVALLGIVVLAAGSAHGGLDALSWRELAHTHSKHALIAYLLLLAGLASKVGWAPVHNWLPDAHSEAPAPVSALLSAALLPAVLLVAWRSSQAVSPVIGASSAQSVLVGFGLLSLAVAVPFLWQPMAWKRLLAYSSLEHMGVIALGIGFGTPLALAGVVVRGIGRTQGPLGSALGISLGALAGLPPSPLFASEVLIVAGGFAAGRPWTAAAAAALLALGFLGLAHTLLETVAGKAPARARTAPGLRGVVLLTSVAVPCLLGLTAAALWLPGSAIARALVQGIR